MRVGGIRSIGAQAAPRAGVGGATGPEPLLVAVALVAAIAALGLYLSGLIVGGAGGHPAASANPVASPDRSGNYPMGVAAPTAFGTVAVGSTDSFGGPTSEDLAGQVHGVADLVAPDRSQIEVAVVLSNRSVDPIPYSSRQFSILVPRRGQGGGEPASRRIAARAGSVEPGRLQPGASVSATASFVVPSRGEELLLRYAEGEGGGPVMVDLGKVGSPTPPEAITQNGLHPGHGS